MSSDMITVWAVKFRLIYVSRSTLYVSQPNEAFATYNLIMIKLTDKGIVEHWGRRVISLVDCFCSYHKIENASFSDFIHG